MTGPEVCIDCKHTACDYRMVRALPNVSPRGWYSQVTQLVPASPVLRAVAFFLLVVLHKITAVVLLRPTQAALLRGDVVQSLQRKASRMSAESGAWSGAYHGQFPGISRSRILTCMQMFCQRHKPAFRSDSHARGKPSAKRTI